MKKIILILVALILLSLSALRAQEQTLIIMSDSPYDPQTWITCGLGNKLDMNEIGEKYNNNFFITSVAHTQSGWFLAMSKNVRWNSQTYSYTTLWPTEWLNEKYREGFYITSIAHASDGWMIVVSKGTGYTDQKWEFGSLTEIDNFIDTYWDKGYRITAMEYMNEKWFVLMSSNSEYSAQNWSRRSTVEKVQEKISEFWDKGYRIQCLEHGGGVYFIVASKFKDGTVPAQSYSINPNDAPGYIGENWDQNRRITYIGGGEHTGSSAVQPVQKQEIAKNNQNNNHNKNAGKKVAVDVTIPYMNGTARHIIYEDGSGYSETSFPCTSLHCANGMCTICNGTGIFVHPYVNYTTVCTACTAGKCNYCKGKGRIMSKKSWAPGEAQAYNNAVRQIKNAGYDVPEKKHNSGVCPDCHGLGYRPKSYQYAAESEFAPYHNYAGDTCPICALKHDHYHYRCTTCKTK